MSQNKTVALFMPSQTSFYEGLFASMKRAFEEYHYSVVGGCGFLEGETLDSFIFEQKPQLFFEMNRCKNEIANFPKDIVHICWLVDLMGRKLEDLGGSEIIYFFATEWMKDFKPDYRCKVDWLAPASDPSVYYPIQESKKDFQSVFLGHIPNPWSEELLQRVVSQKQEKNIYFADVLEHFEQKWASQDSIVNNDVYLQELSSWLGSEEALHVEIEDKTLRYDIGCRIIRRARRAFFLDWLLENAAVKPLGIFGGKNWMHWPQYKAMYQRELHTPSEINSVFNRSQIVLHEGIGLHFRVVDAMMAGSVVLLRKSKQDSEFGGIGTLFEEGKEYLGVDIESERVEIDDALLRNVARRAREKVLAKHTWSHRVSKILKDVDEFNG